MLTSSQNYIDIPEGYYSGGRITTNAATIVGTLTVTYGHHHTGNSSSGGGCYGNSQYHAGDVCHATRICQGVGYERSDGVWECPWRCGYGHTGIDYGVGRQYDGQPVGECGAGSPGYYTYSLSCGKSEGQVVRTSSVYNPGTNEKINKVEIVYN